MYVYVSDIKILKLGDKVKLQKIMKSCELLDGDLKWLIKGVKQLMDQDELIKILLDKSAYEEERAEAADYLSNFLNEKSLSMLSTVARNKNEVAYVKAKAGESLALIMVKQGRMQEIFLKGIDKVAFNEVSAVFKNFKPSWYKNLDKIRDNL